MTAEDSDLGFQDLFDAVVATVEKVPNSLSRSPTILDPRTAPQTILHRLFSVEMQTQNTGKYRDKSGRRIRMENRLTVRTAHRMNPQDQMETQRQAFVDESNVVIQLMTTTDKPICYTRVRYIQTQRQVDPTREWYFTSIILGIEFDFLLDGEVV